jgi:hypothetical protein
MEPERRRRERLLEVTRQAETVNDKRAIKVNDDLISLHCGLLFQKKHANTDDDDLDDYGAKRNGCCLVQKEELI